MISSLSVKSKLHQAAEIFDRIAPMVTSDDLKVQLTHTILLSAAIQELAERCGDIVEILKSRETLPNPPC